MPDFPPDRPCNPRRSSLAAWVVFSQGVGLQQAWTAMLVCEFRLASATRLFFLVPSLLHFATPPDLYRRLSCPSLYCEDGRQRAQSPQPVQKAPSRKVRGGDEERTHWGLSARLAASGLLEGCEVASINS